MSSAQNDSADEQRRAAQSAFADFAKDYERMVGSMTRNIATWSFDYLPAMTSSSVIHDNACGPGVATEAVMAKFEGNTGAEFAPKILATDLAPPMVQLAAAKAKAEGWTNVDTRVLDMVNLDGIPDDHFSHSINNFGLFAASDYSKAVQETYRTLQPGGVAAITHWKHAGTMGIVKRVMDQIRPDIKMAWHKVLPDSDGVAPLPADATEDQKQIREAENFERMLTDVFGEGNVSRELYETQWAADEDTIVESFMSSFWDPIAKVGYTEEDKAKWTPDLIRSAILPEERESGKVQMINWGFFCKKA